jgi:hypothetical protein
MEPKTNFLPRVLLFSGMFAFLFLITFNTEAGDSPKSFYDGIIKLNPACKLKRMSTGEVIVYAKNQEGVDVDHHFNDFYADLLMAAYRKQRIEFIVETFSQKYYLSEDDCRREVKHAMNVLSEWNIIIRDDQVAAR